MKKFATCILILIASVATAATAGSTSARASENDQGIAVTFQKHLVDPANVIFQGSTGGAVKGELESRLVPGSLTIVGELWTFTFDWIVTADAPAKSFVAHATGTMIGSTAGSPVVMDGVVTSGWHQGTAMRMQGQLADPTTFTITGTITIQPGNAGSQ